MAPPFVTAVLPLNVLFITSTLLENEICNAPPSTAHKLFSKILSFIVIFTEPLFIETAPPYRSAIFSLKTLLVTVQFVSIDIATLEPKDA